MSSAPGVLEDVFRTIFIVIIGRMHRDKIMTRPQLLVITLGFDLRDTQTDQAANQAASRAADGCATQRRHDWTRRDQRSNTGNSERANSSEET